ncbi:hypothetical protein PAXINDRAFT_159186 [Paxillus involutus ATCC 200175]|uniref:Uncharacterized protein n=1 Tax=Paxillus involutus ATCC 200175 TaxID=664439 RepID=A0A0C9SLU1_PAXIN|nr:hypothetical protein PAXINDRAFT_159186 [Paxillus involutus ATCC 200175]
MYLNELQMQLGEATGSHVWVATVWRALQRIEYTRKKISKSALEHNESCRLQYMFNIGSEYDYEQLVFVNESAFNQCTTYRQYGWVLKGLRVQQKCFYVRGTRYDVVQNY